MRGKLEGEEGQADSDKEMKMGTLAVVTRYSACFFNQIYASDSGGNGNGRGMRQLSQNRVKMLRRKVTKGGDGRRTRWGQCIHLGGQKIHK